MPTPRPLWQGQSCRRAGMFDTHMMRALSASLASSSDRSSNSVLTWSLVVKATVLARESLSSALCASTATSCSGNVAKILSDCQRLTSLGMTADGVRTHESPISVRFPFFTSEIVLIHLPPKILASHLRNRYPASIFSATTT